MCYTHLGPGVEKKPSGLIGLIAYPDHIVSDQTKKKQSVAAMSSKLIIER